MAEMDKLQTFLLSRESKTYAPYYNGKMSYALHGASWEKYVAEAFPDIKDQQTSENIYKAVIDLYAENLVPVPDELKGFSNILVPLLSRGEAPVIVDPTGEVHFPEHYEMISDGKYTVAAIFTRSIEKMQDFVTFAYSDGRTVLFAKDCPDDFTPASKEGYQWVEETPGNELFRFALDDRGFGASMAALQDRVNHSIIDQTVIAEMYARPFWYLLNVSLPPENPYVAKPAGADDDLMKEQRGTGASGRIFTTSSDGPFGQLEPPTISDMIGYHDSIIDKVSQSSGIPQHYFKPGTGTPPTGVALKVLSKRFNNKIARMRDDLTPELERLATLLGVERTVEIEGQEQNDYELWNTSDDLLQESLDAHGIALSQMGYPLDYIAEVVTPGVDLADYEEDHEPGDNPAVPGQAPDMTATGQPGLVATPGQVASYGANPGQRAVPRGQ
ncbi:portal protein [Microbacterium phage Theresita]|nr:portal protein [Microbacterium phage Theresita]